MVRKKIIEMQTYKYGSYRGDDVMEFDDEQELLEWIEKRVKDTHQTHLDEQEAGESLTKWTGRFRHDGVAYNIVLDC